jgi:hypothetical protein
VVTREARGARSCPVCALTSFHPVDKLTGWCSACERFTGVDEQHVRRAADELAGRGLRGVACAVLWRLDEQLERDAELAR